MSQVIRTVKNGDVTVEITMDTDRLDAIIQKLQRGDTLAWVVQKAAFDVEKTSKMLCPVDTGTLSNSIRAEPVQHGLGGLVYADIAPHTDYALYVEMGHVTRARTYVFGHHYMTRALFQESKKLERAVKAWVNTL